MTEIKKQRKKIAVIGGGIYGTTTALRLVEAGYTVDLIEREDDIMKAASTINQFRLHRGYHYPRSKETIQSTKLGAKMFAAEFPEAVIDNNEHYYCIASRGSLTTREQFISVCDTFNLDYEETNLDILNTENISLCVKVSEKAIDPHALKKLIKEKLIRSGVRIRLNTRVEASMLSEYHTVVVAAYTHMNTVLHALGLPEEREYQYELCEKIVVSLPDSFTNKSMVVLDGPFTCFDPYGNTGHFVMGHVEHAIHHSNVGLYPEVPDAFAPLLNKGVIKNPPITNFSRFIESASEFFPKIKEARHIGSMYTFRTVLPNLEKTDARPTIVETINSSIITIFSGKIGNCVQAANDVLALIESRS